MLGEVELDAQPLTQVPVLKLVAPLQGGGEVDDGEHVG